MEVDGESVGVGLVVRIGSGSVDGGLSVGIDGVAV